MKKRLLLASLLLPLLATAAHAAPLSESVFLESLATPAACATEVAPAALSGQPAPEAKVNTMGCLARLCTTNADCPCTTGAGTCVGGSCQYPPPTGGGGTTLHCPAALCTLDAQCRWNCKAGLHSYCNTGSGESGTCVYLP